MTTPKKYWIQLLDRIIQMPPSTDWSCVKLLSEWKKMPSGRHQAFCSFFIESATQLLVDENRKCLTAFSALLALFPESSKELYTAIETKLETYDGISMLLLLAEYFDVITKNAPSQPFSIWKMWGEVMLRLGEKLEDPDCLGTADEMLKRASAHLSTISEKNRRELFLLKTLSYYAQGMISGEISDLLRAKKSLDYIWNEGYSTLSEWRLRGDVHFQLYLLSPSEELLIEANRSYYIALRLGAKPSTIQQALAITNAHLYLATQDSCYSSEAEHGFQALQEERELTDSEALLLAQVQLQLGTSKSLSSTIIEGLNLMDQLVERLPLSAREYCLWIIAEMRLATLEQDGTRFQRAKKHLKEALSLHKNDRELLWVEGELFLELGLYFDECSYFQNALSCFEKGMVAFPDEMSYLCSAARASFEIFRLTRQTEKLEAAVGYMEGIHSPELLQAGTILSDWGNYLVELGIAKRSRSYLEEGIQKFRLAMETAQEDFFGIDINAISDLANGYSHLGHLTGETQFLEKAIEGWKEILSIAPDRSAECSLAISLSCLGEETDNEELLHNACYLFLRLAQQEPEDGGLWNEWGQTELSLAELKRHSDFEEADRHYRSAE
ncbi:MAG: hypothetical protein KDK40_05185, partial [Chlamydiia bacterium]|nr:hypothetical protein [Chlamydiia bacterium]